MTRNNKIVCVCELKYVPNGYVPYEKDIITFGKFNSLKETEFQIYLESEPLTGDWNYDRKFTIDSNVLFAYLVIGKADSDAFTKAQEIWHDTELTPTPITNYLYLMGIVEKGIAVEFSNYPD